MMYAICKVRNDQGSHTDGCSQSYADDINALVEVEFSYDHHDRRWLFERPYGSVSV